MTGDHHGPDTAAGSRIGFVFVSHVGAPRSEAFFNQIIAGLDDVLAGSGSELVVRVVDEAEEELAVYRHWSQAGLVDAVVIKDLQANDPRFDQLADMGLPFMALTDVTHSGPFSAVRFDNGQAMRDAVQFLLRLGHRRLARVAGPESLIHTQRRTEVFWQAVTEAGVSAAVQVGDYSRASGEAATMDLLRSEHSPTAIIYDNDLMALGGLEAADALGLEVPGELSLLAWDDSVQCQLAVPALSALSHDVHQMGVQLGHALVEQLSGDGPISAIASGLVVVERQTTAAPPDSAESPLHPRLHQDGSGNDPTVVTEADRAETVARQTTPNTDGRP
ncbi:substrate-binding domain-containing protein [Pseudactinotalea terrae]|uniref:substrate-binding domain-containing protein n=1 Tax=Pseudactinotalea terrae TaxID=1743262 RepID=UPI0012E1F1C1|nr:substrate-binding domain-containing protein [Pseudactinotalea terrae]